MRMCTYIFLELCKRLSTWREKGYFRVNTVRFFFFRLEVFFDIVEVEGRFFSCRVKFSFFGSSYGLASFIFFLVFRLVGRRVGIFWRSLDI